MGWKPVGRRAVTMDRDTPRTVVVLCAALLLAAAAGGCVQTTSASVQAVSSAAPVDLKALQAECGKASTTNPFADGKRHGEMLSTPLGEILAIQGGWQQGAPRVMPSRVIFAIAGIGYTIESTSAEPIPVGQLVALAGTMR